MMINIMIAAPQSPNDGTAHGMRNFPLTNKQKRNGRRYSPVCTRVGFSLLVKCCLRPTRLLQSGELSYYYY